MIQPARVMDARRPARRSAEPHTEKFRSAAAAWFWTMGALVARREGSARSTPGIPRPCEPDDVVRALDTLYRQRRIDLVHARILRIWGERQTEPNAGYPSERKDAMLWNEAMDRLSFVLRVKIIID